MKPTPACIVCRSAAHFDFSKDGYDEYRCPECGLIFVHPQPTEQELDDLYSSVVGYQRGKVRRAHKQLPIHETYRKIISFLREQKVDSVLDVGCSSGDFLARVDEAGMKAVGVEPNDTTAVDAQARGLEVHIGTLDAVDVPRGTFGAAHAGDVIEHVPDPRAFVSEMRNMLKPGGYLVIVTPTIDCFWARATYRLHQWFGLPWSIITPPWHLWQFSEHTLDRLLADYDCTLTKRWYNHLPNLKYELGATHTLGAFKRQRSFKTLLTFLGVATLYPVVFALNYVTKSVRKNDMGMISVYQYQSTETTQE
jgi:SAM-dependent methyltransferase